MYTSILLVALTGVSAPVEGTKAPSWSQDYTSARKQAIAEKKPLAVFLAPGKGAWDKIGRDGVSADANSVLGSQYVCVHVDTSTSPGKVLAEAFEIPSGLGIVISDRTGDIQAFRHEGDLANQDLVRYLERYSDPTRVALVTESNPGHERGGAISYQQGYCSSCSSCSGGGCSGGGCSGGGCSGGHSGRRSGGHLGGHRHSGGGCR
jgi:hypothetical protein